jgi:hypothetical protein
LRQRGQDRREDGTAAGFVGLGGPGEDEPLDGVPVLLDPREEPGPADERTVEVPDRPEEEVGLALRAGQGVEAREELRGVGHPAAEVAPGGRRGVGLAGEPAVQLVDRHRGVGVRTLHGSTP